MVQLSEQARIEEIVAKHRASARSVKKLPLMSAFPFLSPELLLASGLAGGAYAAYQNMLAGKADLPLEIHKRYRALPVKNAELARHIYLGHALDMRDYKNQLHKCTRSRGYLNEKEMLQFEMDMLKRMRSIYLTDDMATRHLFVGGSTGIGKTELYLSVLYQQIARGGGAILFDAKGDEKTFSRVYAIMKMFNREHDLEYMNFDRPGMSHTYNPLINGNTRQIISTKMKLAGETKEEFFKRLNQEGIAAMVECLRAQPNKPRFNFKDLAALLTDFKYFQELFANIPKEKKNEREFVYMFLKNFIKFDERAGKEVVNETRYKELMQGLKGIMMGFAHSEYAELLNDYNPDIEILDAIMNNKVIIITVPALSDREGARLFGRLFLADFSRAVGEINNMRVRSLIPYYVFLDEYGSFADESHIELFQQARSANVSMWLSVQGRGFIDAAGQFFGDNMITNCWNHIYLDTRDDNTRKTAAALAGTAMVRFKQDSVGESFGAAHSSAVSGAIREENTGQNVSVGTREMREELLQPDDFNMSEGQAIMVGKFANMRLQLPMTHFDDNFVPQIEDIQLSRKSKNPAMGLDLAARALSEGEDIVAGRNGV